MKKCWVLMLLFAFPIHQSYCSEMNVSELIQQVRSDVVDLTSVFDLYNSDSFFLLKDQMTVCDDEYIDYILSPDNDYVNKYILVYAMQSLPFVEYVKVLDVMSVEYCNGGIDEKLAFRIIMPGFEWNKNVVENYKDERIVSALTRFRSCPDNSELFNDFIDRILSGKMLKQMRKFLDANYN